MENIARSSMEKIRDCLQDYSNDFMGLNILLDGGGIENVRRQIRNGFRIATIGEHLEKDRRENREMISPEDQKDPVFIEKAESLDDLARTINSLGEAIDERTIKETIERVKKIIY